MGLLFVLFVVVPAVELALLIRVGQVIGPGRTLLLILFTGLLGATLARIQGLGVLRRLQAELAAGRMPGDALFDGAIILVAAALLVTPGILTDAVGFLCLVPAVRKLIKRALAARYAARVERSSVHFDFGPGDEGAGRAEPGWRERGRTIDVDAEIRESD